METKQRSGFTKSGFSKAGFAACGHWNECDMGRQTCHYAQSDPEVKDLCSCYIRNHSDANEDKNLSVEDNVDSNSEAAQLSLF